MASENCLGWAKPERACQSVGLAPDTDLAQGWSGPVTVDELENAGTAMSR